MGTGQGQGHGKLRNFGTKGQLHLMIEVVDFSQIPSLHFTVTRISVVEKRR
jgi:hypothetical protein